ncbi:MAG: cytochrome c3 family protein [Candidatus Kapaibacteriota bacterium]
MKHKLVLKLILVSLIFLNFYLVINFLRSGKYLSMPQQISFSHKSHLKYKISCLFCHYKAETNSYANLPSTKDCMICHIALKTESELLRKVIISYDSLFTITYRKTHDLPDYVKFTHSIHINSGIDCATCHGFVEEMDSLYQVRNLTMGWCVDCHRNPNKYNIPPREISGIVYSQEILTAFDSVIFSSKNLGYFIVPRKLAPASTDCSICHY